MKYMEYKGFKARIMKAERLVGEKTHSLPPGSPIDIYPVDMFKKPLSNWISGPGNYVVPVDANCGLWFDWTMNDEMNTAVLLSIKGMNPITGKRTNGFSLERYEEKCPIHDIQFKDGLFCEKCNYKWPAQNYVSYPNRLWWDGFRSEDGKVRQFFFTDELEKSIPELVIGKEDTIPAFGFAFFSPKVKREQINFVQKSYEKNHDCHEIKGSNAVWINSLKNDMYITKSNFLSCLDENKFSSSSGTLSISEKIRSLNSSDSLLGHSNLLASVNYQDFQRNEVKQKKQIAEVGVGAGAIIDQKLNVDQLKVSDWNGTPDSVMRLYFIFIEQFEQIKSYGLKDLVGEKEGFLSGLPVG